MKTQFRWSRNLYLCMITGVFSLSFFNLNTPNALGQAQVIRVPPIPSAPTLSDRHQQDLRQIFPTAQRLVSRRIPEVMLLSKKSPHKVYVEVFATHNQRLGYARFFDTFTITGPNKRKRNLSFVIAYDLEFKPLRIQFRRSFPKINQKAWQEADSERLIQLLQKPPTALNRIFKAKDLFTGKKNVLRQELRDAIVPSAPIVTWEIFKISQRTHKILQQTPTWWDQQRLQTILDQNLSDLHLAQHLAAFLLTSQTVTVREIAYKMLIKHYLAALTAKQSPLSVIDNKILWPHLDPKTELNKIAQACYKFVSLETHFPLVKTCIKRIEDANIYRADTHYANLLKGTLSFFQRDYTTALTLLQKATQNITSDQDPELHFRYAQSLAAKHQIHDACNHMTTLFLAHPQLPDLENKLTLCATQKKETTTLLKELRKRQKDFLYQQNREEGSPVSILNLEGPNHELVELDLTKAKKISILVFFSTWCPHCSIELPRINHFVHTLKTSTYKTKVQVIGIRTAVERDSISFDKFIKDLKPTFTIYHDPTMSFEFSRFARFHGIRAALPTLAVADPKGVVRFLVPSGSYRDTARELRWAVEYILEHTKTDG